MKKNLLLSLIIYCTLLSNQVPLSHMNVISYPDDVEYVRGNYLIVLPDVSNNLESTLEAFINHKMTQGFTVDIQKCGDGFECGDASLLRDSIQSYFSTHPLLEYVLLIGDIDDSYEIPAHTISSYNPPIVPDVTDYPNTYTDDSMSPDFFIGRWSVGSTSDLKKLRDRTINYELPDRDDASYLNNSLIVAGNYKTADGEYVPPSSWPVTPRYTSLWIHEQLNEYHLDNNTNGAIDTVFFTADNQTVSSNDITTSWNNGVGLVNYRGWGDVNGWHKPEFHMDDFNDLTTNYLPVVFSFVCNTGDFGNTVDPSFGEDILTIGSTSNPKGAVAVIAPSDLDTDTRFNNVICGAMWDALLEGKTAELGPALHYGKNSLINEFGDLTVNGTNIAHFYHHVYGVLGDPSLSVWLSEPKSMGCDGCDNLTSSGSVNITVSDSETGNALPYPVGSITGVDNTGSVVLLASSVGNSCGNISLNADSSLDNYSDITLYINKSQYFQESYSIEYSASASDEVGDTACSPPTAPVYDDYSVYDSMWPEEYEFTPSYDWVEINETGTNLYLTDDSVEKNIPLGFDFTYFGETYNSVTVSSNGWISFKPCDIPYFWNFSIPFPMGPDAMIAPFMDDLDDNQGTEDFNVYFLTDTDNNKCIVQWDNVANGENDELCPENCDRETFQVILQARDDGNGDILFQYKEVNDIDFNGNYSTVGIESPDQNSGVQYQFNGNTLVDGTPLNDGMAILFTQDGDRFLDIINDMPYQTSTNIYAFPNPFNPYTDIRFSIESPSFVSVLVHDINGRVIDTILSEQYLGRGEYQSRWQPSEVVPSGIYLIRYVADNHSLSKLVSYIK